jgi:hypothetical protein
MLSTALSELRLIDPVVIFDVPHPATLAANANAIVAVRSLFPVAFVRRLVNICARSPIV